MTHLRRLLTWSRRGLVVLGLTVAAVAVVAAFAAAIKFTADLRQDRSGQRDPDVQAERVPSPPSYPESDYREARLPRPTDRPLIGVNYTHHGFSNCRLDGTNILRTYSNPGIAQKVHKQLFQMRRSGIATLRTIVFHMTDATGRTWGPIPSAGGRLHEPYRTNLVRFVTEVKRFGFTRFTAALGPTEENNPRLAVYDASKLGENWRFLKDVRSVVKRYGPRDTRIDLMSEGAPSEAPSEYFPYPRQIGRYLRTMYRRYVDQFGNRDVTVSTIGATHPGDMTNRLGTLVRILKSTREPLPRWYELHLPYEPVSAAFALRDADRVLRANSQDRPLVIGEAVYDHRGVAQVVKRFLQRSARRIDEITPWFLRERKGCWVPPPYAPGAYGRVLHRR